jgi:predicted dehydrogenase
VGVIGTGGRGTNLIQTLAEVEGMEVNACCDILPFRLDRALALSPGAKGFKDYRELLDHSDLDAVIVATPLNTHFEIVKDSLDAGKHVYCEKTMTFTLDETKKLEGIIKDSGRKFQVGYQHRFNLVYHKVLEYISGDEFGPLSHIECYWNRNGDWRRPVPDPKWERVINWRMYKEYSGGLLAELTSHQLNIVNWMLGSVPERVVGFGGVDYWKDGRETYDNIHLIYDYPGGLKVSCTSLTTNAEMGFQMKFYGKNATIELTRENNYAARLFVEPTYYQSFEKSSNTEVDGTTGATELLQKGEPITIYESAPGEEDAGPTRDGLASFGRDIREDRIPEVGYDSGRDSAICVALGNMAMEKGTVIHWKDYV